jgi:hypothetical protein
MTTERGIVVPLLLRPWSFLPDAKFYLSSARKSRCNALSGGGMIFQANRGRGRPVGNHSAQAHSPGTATVAAKGLRAAASNVDLIRMTETLRYQ